MTDKDREKQEKKIQRAKQESDFQWIIICLAALVVLGFITI